VRGFIFIQMKPNKTKRMAKRPKPNAGIRRECQLSWRSPARRRSKPIPMLRQLERRATGDLEAMLEPPGPFVHDELMIDEHRATTVTMTMTTGSSSCSMKENEPRTPGRLMQSQVESSRSRIGREMLIMSRSSSSIGNPEEMQSRTETKSAPNQAANSEHRDATSSMMMMTVTTVTMTTESELEPIQTKPILERLSASSRAVRQEQLHSRPAAREPRQLERRRPSLELKPGPAPARLTSAEELELKLECQIRRAPLPHWRPHRRPQ